MALRRKPQSGRAPYRSKTEFTQPIKSSATFTLSSPNDIPPGVQKTPMARKGLQANPTTPLEGEDLILPITLSFGTTLGITHAMVDTGSQGVLWTVENVLSHHTAPLTLQIGDHYELIEFKIATFAHYPVILGIPWVRKHDVSSLPSENRVLFTSSHCAQHCLPLSNTT
ncbi:hypothetical protein JCM11491_002520 [Sporobolomyces phaffii]